MKTNFTIRQATGDNLGDLIKKKTIKSKIYKAKITTSKFEYVKGEIHEIINNLQCGKCDSILYGYDEVICPVCGAYNDFE